MSIEVKKRSSILGMLVRFVVNAIVLMVISFFIPGFFIKSFWVAILAAVVISFLDYGVQAIFKIDASPLGRGISGFILSAVIIYLTAVLIPGFAVTFWGTIIGALLIGIVDLVLPVDVF
jgi:putative membrane protein